METDSALMAQAAADENVVLPTPSSEGIAAAENNAVLAPEVAQAFQRSSTALSLVAIVSGLAVLYFAQFVFVVLCFSILLAFVLAPLVDLLQKAHLPRTVAALLSVLILLGALFGLGVVSYNRALDFSKEFPKYSGELRTLLNRVTGPARALEKTTESVIPVDNDKRVTLVRQQNDWTDRLTNNLGTASEMLFAASFVPFLAYFMLSWQQHARSSTVLLFRRQYRTTAYAALGEISDMVRSFIIGNFLIGLILGIVSTAAFGILHIPYFYFVGFISGFVSLVPYLGMVLALAPPILSGLGHLSSADILGVIVSVLGFHLLAMNVLYPKLLGKRLQLNPLAVTVGLLFWGWIWGALGLILAIPIIAALKIIFDRIESLKAFGVLLGE